MKWNSDPTDTATALAMIAPELAESNDVDRKEGNRRQAERNGTDHSTRLTPYIRQLAFILAVAFQRED